MQQTATSQMATVPPSAKTRFTSPFDVATPEGAEGWQGLYPYYALISPERREMEEEKLWFFDGMHSPAPLYPFDTIMTENWWVAASQMTNRVWPIPLAQGIDHRIINGYLYVSPNAVTDPDEIAKRAEHFNSRAGHYYENWDFIYGEWETKARDCIERLKAIEFKPLPELVPEEQVFGHRGLYSSHDLLTSYNTLIQNMLEMGSYHFEMLNLGYGAYLTFREFCQEAFPGISDQTITHMVSGIDILLFRPDDEVRGLAELAVELGLDGVILENEAPEAMLDAIKAAPKGEQWLAAYEEAREPWFWFSTGVGYTHEDPVWMTDPRMPFSAMRGYIKSLKGGEDIRRPLDEIIEKRTRVTAEYRELLPSEVDREAFDGLVELARKVYPFVENHNFYVEHWHHSLFWEKVRELGDVFVAHNFFDDRDDIFYLHRHEIYDALYDVLIGWAVGTPPRGEVYWRPLIAKRKQIRDALCQWSPPPALGVPPESITEPLTIMLWGITQETILEWLGVDGSNDGELRGVAASPGKATGRARVITDFAQLYDVEDDEILVCRITAPSWAPIFQRVAAAVSDVGGMMAHTAIISREYGLPAVVGTGFATTSIKTGDLVEVDGNEGTVRVVDEEAAS
ncbi:PEP-utilizing enzyme [Halomonas sp. MES3-P3E]|uniref:PEP-utilizing enzyme n=1 Tax=Halomonas sp. MES3-P3E TaxID=2058321 RepID=UPI0018E308BF|nr:PEP-utilizing enzyme [Halomonas sp. MES3-P3E]